jgi:hypothetical protein
MVDLVDADRSKAKGGRDFVAEECGRGISFIDIDELVRDQAVTVECLPVGQVGWRKRSVPNMFSIPEG